jgi:hypothetical protein
VPATHLLYRHDDGRWYRAAIVQQVRAGPDRRWRVLVTYRTAPGFNYARGEWADSELLRPEPQHDEQRDAGGAHGDAEGEHEAAQQRSGIARHSTRA